MTKGAKRDLVCHGVVTKDACIIVPLWFPPCQT